MNALPPNRRGVGAGMSTTFQNSAMALSLGIFFSLMVTGLAPSLPATLGSGLTAHGVSALDAACLTGRGFFPTLLSAPFAAGLTVAVGFAIIACLVAAAASALQGGTYASTDPTPAQSALPPAPEAAVRACGGSDVENYGTPAGERRSPVVRRRMGQAGPMIRALPSKALDHCA